MRRIRVCIRTKPTQNFAQDHLLIDREHNAIQINKKVNRMIIQQKLFIFVHSRVLMRVLL